MRTFSFSSFAAVFYWGTNFSNTRKSIRYWELRFPFLGKNAPAESVTHVLESIEWYGPAKSLFTIMIQIRNVLFTIILPLALFDCSRLLNDCRMQQFIFLKYRTFSTGHALSKDTKPDDSTMRTLGKTDSIYFFINGFPFSIFCFSS